MSARRSVCVSARLSVCVFVCLPVCLCVCVFACASVRPSACLCTCLFVCRSVSSHRPPCTCLLQLSLEPVAGQVGHSLDAWALLRSEGDPRKMKHELSCFIMRLGPRHVLSFSGRLHRVALGCVGLVRAALGCLGLFRIALGCLDLRCLVGLRWQCDRDPAECQADQHFAV